MINALFLVFIRNRTFGKMTKNTNETGKIEVIDGGNEVCSSREWGNIRRIK